MLVRLLPPLCNVELFSESAFQMAVLGQYMARGHPVNLDCRGTLPLG